MDFRKHLIHPASRGVAAHTADFFGSSHIYTYTHTHIYIDMYIYICVYLYISIYMYIPISLYIFICISIYIYIYGFVTMLPWNCPWSSAAGQLKHRYYKKSFQDIACHSVYTIFPVKNTVICTLCPQESIQNTSFCSVFNTLASKNLSKYR